MVKKITESSEFDTIKKGRTEEDEELEEIFDIGAEVNPNINLNLDASGSSVGFLGGVAGSAGNGVGGFGEDTFDDDEDVDNLEEGNPVIVDLPPSVDSFLQDLAQAHGSFTYKNIMDHEFTEEEVKTLRRLRRQYNALAEYGVDEEDDDLNEIVDKVEDIVCRKKEEGLTLKEAVSSDYKVFTLAMDVAFPEGKTPRDYGVDSSVPGSQLFKELSKALGTLGLEMAGDYVSQEADVTDIYKDNDYEFFEEGLTLKEAVNDWEVKQVSFDVAVKKGTDLNCQAMSGNTEFYRALCKFLSSQGMEMAGDMIDSHDMTDIYKDNDYEFFEGRGI